MPGADSQNNFQIELEPIMPFDPFSFSTDEVLYKMIFRPAFLLKFAQPVLKEDGNWKGANFGIGDLNFDLDFAASYKSGYLWALGVNGKIPMGTRKALTSGRWGLGPELVLGHISEKFVAAGLFAHQIDVGGWKGESTNVSEVNPIFAYMPGGGWSINSNSVATYNHRSNEWTVPINAGIFKTVQWGNTPVQLGAEINYFVNQPDDFGPDWQISFNITPVLPNPIASWLSW